jgi:hypothetical protein
MMKAMRLKPEVYEEVEADPTSAGGAILVVIVASVAAAVGTGTLTPAGITAVTLFALLSWMVWIGLTLIIGKWVMPGPETDADIGQVLRTTGFSVAPGVFRIFGSLPVVGLSIFLGATLWMLLAFVVAVRQSLDYASSGRAIAVCLLGWIIHGLLFFAFVMTAL